MKDFKWNQHNASVVLAPFSLGLYITNLYFLERSYARSGKGAYSTIASVGSAENAILGDFCTSSERLKSGGNHKKYWAMGRALCHIWLFSRICSLGSNFRRTCKIFWSLGPLLLSRLFRSGSSLVLALMLKAVQVASNFGFCALIFDVIYIYSLFCKAKDLDLVLPFSNGLK